MSQRPRSRPPGADASSFSVSPRAWLGRSRRLVLAGALLALLGLVLGLGGVAPTAARAAGTDIVSIPDANLKKALNRKISTARPATQDITVAEAASATGTASLAGPIADLTGLEAFTNVTGLTIGGTGAANTFTNLQPIASMTKLTSVNLANGSATDLGPLATLPSLTTLTLNGFPLETLQPLATMTKLTSINLTSSSGQAADLGPLAALPNVTQLTLSAFPITDARPLATMPKLTSLSLGDTKISDAAKLPDVPALTTLNLEGSEVADLSRLPSLPNVTNLSLFGNRIVNVAPLLLKVDATKLTKLELSGNRIADVASLSSLATAKLGQTANGLRISDNRIADLSPLDGYTSPLTDAQTGPQQLYVGAYPDGGIVLPELKDVASVAAQNDSLQVTPATAGSYDLTTHRVTLTDPTTPSVSITAKVTLSTDRETRWVVNFTGPPVAPGEDTGTKLLVGNWDTPTVDEFEPVDGPVRLTQRLQVSAPGDVFDGTTCASFSYHWLRDGQEITGTQYSAVDSAGLASGFGWNDRNVQYHVAAQDVGHQLSVRVTCDSTGVSAQSAAWPALGEAPDVPFVGDAASVTGFSHTIEVPAASYSLAERSGVVADPDNPVIPVYIGQAGATGTLVDPSQLTVRFVSAQALGSTTPVTADQVAITGTGATREIAITPTGVTDSVLTFELTGTTGQKTTFTERYVASRATTPTSHVLLGMSDASTAIAVGDGYMIVGDDEKRDFRLYDATKSGREAANFVNPDTGPGGAEMDTEASARKGNTIWWFGSNGKDKDGASQPGRSAIVKSTLTGSGADAKLTIDPSSDFYNLKDDLVSWDNAHGQRLGIGNAVIGSPDATALGGLDLEGAEFSRDDSELYLAFRSPVSPATVGGKAVLVPIENLEELTTNPSTAHAQFGEPILFDLGGDSIREIRKNDAGEYLILSAPAGDPDVTAPPTQTLWAWNGDPQVAPRKLTTVLPKDVEPFWRDNPGAWEGIGEMPARLTPGAKVQLLMDQGEDVFYDTTAAGSPNKKDPNSWTNKARTDVVTLAGPAGTVAALTTPGAFPAQAANTIGSPQTVTVTNTGSNVLHVGAVSTTDQDQASADDFLISGNTCTGKTLGLDQSCTVRVRYAPSRQNATSTASLVVESDVVSGTDSVPLSGTSTTLPKGDPGEDGQDGTGTPGQDGDKGDKGDAGAQGGNGQDGAIGPLGPLGPIGPLGPVGPIGPQGPGGPAGKDGTFAFSAKRASVKVRRGHTASLSFSVTNGTKALVHGATAKANAPKRLRISGRSSATVASLKAGQSRTVTVHLKVGRTAKAGSYKVPVKLTVAGKSVTRTVTVRVNR